MKLIEHTKPKIIIADEGKKIKSKDDFYVKEHVDEFIAKLRKVLA